MRVLLVTSFFPTPAEPMLGTFITERVRAHRELGHTVTAVAPTNTYHPALGRLGALLGRSPSALAEGSVFVASDTRLGPREYYGIRRQRAGPGFLRRRVESILEVAGVEHDVIHAHGMYYPAAGVLADALSELTGAPFVVSLHGSDVNEVMARHAAAYVPVLGRASSVICVSEALVRRARALGATSASYEVIPNGVDPGLFTAEDRASRTGARTPVVAFVGRLVATKGADRLPSIFRCISEAHGPVRFLVGGQGPLAEEIRSRTHGLDVEILGALDRPEVARVFRTADVVVLPSRSEGWPTIVLESHASGTPVVVADVGGSREAVGDDRFVVDPGPDLERRFAARVVDVLRGELEPSDLRARAVEHTWANVAAQETAVYERARGAAIPGV